VSARIEENNKMRKAWKTREGYQCAHRGGMGDWRLSKLKKCILIKGA